MRFSTSVAVVLGAVAPLCADAAASAADTVTPGGPEILNLVGSLIVVIGAILAFGWLYTRLRPGMNQGSELIRLVAVRPIGPKERLVVVDVAGEQLLVGVSAAGMRTLHTLREPVEQAPIAGAAQSRFAERLKSLLGEPAK